MLMIQSRVSTLSSVACPTTRFCSYGDQEDVGKVCCFTCFDANPIALGCHALRSFLAHLQGSLCDLLLGRGRLIRSCFNTAVHYGDALARSEQCRSADERQRQRFDLWIPSERETSPGDRCALSDMPGLTFLPVSFSTRMST